LVSLYPAAFPDLTLRQLVVSKRISYLFKSYIMLFIKFKVHLGAQALTAIDFLLAVDDVSRVGALRFFRMSTGSSNELRTKDAVPRPVGTPILNGGQSGPPLFVPTASGQGTFGA
jgi:hypothetical protein